jgi:hypothetical protein
LQELIEDMSLYEQYWISTAEQDCGHNLPGSQKELQGDLYLLVDIAS